MKKCGVKEILMKKMWRKGNHNENLIDLVKSCPTRVYYYLVLLAKRGFDTAEIEPRKVWVTELADLMFRSHNESLVIAVSVREFETPQFGFGS